ncbi:TonB-dependent receptor [Flagellimonas sp. CMM7]|uniref:SusC/RagA family TonB-linked outer membrane protein n=1 Tax=Flagellimonas sp. CMM7 TaxID=2654676 RepID=UPI0013D4D179|nr:TonB-dependent receptor [Flagellimonas sp. CMM7]UII79867.1 TonB-dependent receptor [Flagellimonas sp. CMM7]
MKYKNNICKALWVLGLFLGIQSSVIAQATITGTIYDETGLPLSGATVIEKSTTNGVAADFDGRFSIEVSDSNASLVVSFVGYIAQEIDLAGRTNLEVNMQPDQNVLEQVVVVGYGSQKKSSLTGAVSIIDVGETEKMQYTNITDRLQGRTAGVAVTGNGLPGDIGDIRIRGSIFAGNNDPLYVVDGVILNEAPTINPSDVENIQILKDASSAAIYGSRAANGVIVITTKQGKPGRLSVSANVTTGFQQIGTRLDMANAEQWARIVRSAYDSPYASGLQLAHAFNLPGIDTDWQDEVYKTALLQDANVTVSGGGDRFTALMGVNHTYQEGTVPGPKFDRSGIRINTSYEIIKDRLKVGQNLALNRVRLSGGASEDNATFSGNVVASALDALPVVPVLDPTKISGYGHGDVNNLSFVVNPIGFAALYKTTTETNNILGNIYADFEIIDGLNYHFSFGLEQSSSYEKSFNKRSQLRRSTLIGSSLSVNHNEARNYYLEHRLSFEKTLGRHTFSLMGAYNDLETTDFSSGVAYDESLNAFESGLFELVAATPNGGGAPAISSSRGTVVTQSLLSRFTYDYDDRYLLKASVRRDAFSSFLGDNRDDVFPSLDLGWNVSNESFFNIEAISRLKLRAAYGEVGYNEAGDGSSPYFATSTIVRGAGGPNYNLGPTGDPVTGATRSNLLANPDISWAKVRGYNFGIDLELFNGKLAFEGNYYVDDIEDVLADVEVPGTAGPTIATTVTLNAVTNERKGWEANLTYRKTEGDFKFQISANASGNETQVKKVPQGFTGIVSNSITSVGQPRARLFVLDYQGLYTQQEIDNLPSGFQVGDFPPIVGDAKYRDVNGDNRIDAQDRVAVGNTLPRVQFGFNFSATYKNLDFTAFLSGLAGRDVLNLPLLGLHSDISSNYPANYDPYINGVGTYPRPQTSAEHGNYTASTLYVENGSFVKLRNLQIGYTIPWDDVDNLRVFVSGQNLFTWTDFTSLEPEFEGDFFTAGEADLGYPVVRSISLGLNVSL